MSGYLGLIGKAVHHCFAGSVNLSGPIFNPHPNEMPYYKEPSYPGSYPYPDGQRPNSEPLLKRALSEETGKTNTREHKRKLNFSILIDPV